MNSRRFGIWLASLPHAPSAIATPMRGWTLARAWKGVTPFRTYVYVVGAERLPGP